MSPYLHSGTRDAGPPTPGENGCGGSVVGGRGSAGGRSHSQESPIRVWMLAGSLCYAAQCSSRKEQPRNALCGRTHRHTSCLAFSLPGKVGTLVAGCLSSKEGARDEINATVWLYVERSLLNRPGVMSAYPGCGSGEPCDSENRPDFRPNNPLTRGQISKIVAKHVLPQLPDSWQVDPAAGWSNHSAAYPW
jgi:hypothetical protein